MSKPYENKLDAVARLAHLLNELVKIAKSNNRRYRANINRLNLLKHPKARGGLLNLDGRKPGDTLYKLCHRYKR